MENKLTFKNRITRYGRLTPKNITELKTWDKVHVYLIGLYKKSIKQQNVGSATIKIYVSIVYMTMVAPVTGRFEMAEVPTFILDEVMPYSSLENARNWRKTMPRCLVLYLCMKLRFLSTSNQT